MLLTLMVEPRKCPMRYYSEPTENSLCRAVSFGCDSVYNIKSMRLTDDIAIIFADRPTIFDYRANRYIDGYLIPGTFLVVRVNDKNNIISLREEDIDTYWTLLAKPQKISSSEEIDASVEQFLAELEQA